MFFLSSLPAKILGQASQRREAKNEKEIGKVKRYKPGKISKQPFIVHSLEKPHAEPNFLLYTVIVLALERYYLRILFLYLSAGGG